MSSRHLLLDPHAQDLLFRKARTAHAFTGEPVDDELLAAVHELVKWAPTSFNQQPLRIVLVRSDEARRRLVPLMWDCNQAKTATAPLVAVLGADLGFHEYLPEQFPAFPQAKDVFFSNDDVRCESAVLNASIQIGYFILGVRAAGLAVGPMTGFQADKVSAEFFPDGRHRALAVINMGRPSTGAWFDRLPRLPYDRVFTSC
ncbi:malonic semialdehyde reductase [Actinophytocola sp.]|uniref:malonic semialdehyde reductase n=1 Tax=Actinophytocola sp. TaxID=1872138 RepID=UPI002ED242B1